MDDGSDKYVRKGTLLVRGKTSLGTHKWKPKSCILLENGSFLFYAADGKRSQPSNFGSISLRGGRDDVSVKPSNKRRYCFALTGSGHQKNFYFQAISSLEVEGWIEDIRLVIDKFSGQRLTVFVPFRPIQEPSLSSQSEALPISVRHLSPSQMDDYFSTRRTSSEAGTSTTLMTIGSPTQTSLLLSALKRTTSESAKPHILEGTASPDSPADEEDDDDLAFYALALKPSRRGSEYLPVVEEVRQLSFSESESIQVPRLGASQVVLTYDASEESRSPRSQPGSPRHPESPRQQQESPRMGRNQSTTRSSRRWIYSTQPTEIKSLRVNLADISILDNDPLRLTASSPSPPASPLASSTSSGSGPSSGASTPTSSSRPGSGETNPYKMRVRSAGRAPPRVDISNIASSPPLQSPPGSPPGADSRQTINDPTTPPARPRRGNGVPVVLPIEHATMTERAAPSSPRF